jgi:hypothetical protein
MLRPLALPWVLAGCALATPAPTAKPLPAAVGAELAGSFRRDHDGWRTARLTGAPERIGFQHGYWFAEEIAEVVATMHATVRNDTGRPWEFFRDAARRIFWPQVPDELRAELLGMVAGVRAHGQAVDLWDLVAENAYFEISWYYIPSLKRAEAARGRTVRRVPPGACSAFIATGSATATGRVVIAHSAWVSYWLGRHWNLLLDLAPTRGHRFVMDALPGLVHSGSDFYLSDAGLMVTETTIPQFRGFDPLGVPEFVRARSAIQFADSIDGWIATMARRSNGGYANSWLLGDRRSGEIARLENGLRQQPVTRTRDGFFAGANFPSDPALTARETDYHARPDSSMEARRQRWLKLLTERHGRIDVAAAQAMLADHYDVVAGRVRLGVRALCGHGEVDPDPRPEWDEPAFAPSGAVNAKVSDSELAESLALLAAAGRPCGQPFVAAPFLAAHPEFAWQRSVLRDLPGGRFVLFRPAP